MDGDASHSSEKTESIVPIHLSLSVHNTRERGVVENVVECPSREESVDVVSDDQQSELLHAQLVPCVHV